MLMAWLRAVGGARLALRGAPGCAGSRRRRGWPSRRRSLLGDRRAARDRARGQRREPRARRRRSTRWCAQRAALRADIGRKVQRGQPRGRAGAQPARRADVGADAERRGVQPRRPHPALQQPRAARSSARCRDAPALADGAELIGLGRSIYAVLDRKLVAHALESVQQRLQRGAAQPVGAVRHQHARRAAAARADGAGARDRRAAEAADAALSGFVLMLDNITRDFADESERDQLLHDADRRQPRVARQPAGGGRDARLPRPRRARRASASTA